MGRRVRRSLFLGIMLLALALRLRGIANPLLDNQAWRQADTASMGLNMLGHLSHLPDVFLPRLMYDGSVPQKVELEFPFLPYLLAWTWSAFGWADVWGRLWAVFFSLLALWGLYDLGRNLFDERLALIAAGLYAVTPQAVYYGRVVMPEPVAQALSLWSLALVYRWQKKGQRGFPILQALVLSGAVLAKLPQLMLVPVAVILGFWPWRREKILAVKTLAFYLVASLGPVVLYYGWVHREVQGAGQFVSGILTQQVASGKELYLQALTKNLDNGFTRIELVLALAGLGLLLGRTSRALRPMLVWTGVNAFYVGVVCVRIPLDYYLFPLVPWLALMAAGALASCKDTPGNVLAVVVISLVCFNGYSLLTPKYAWNPANLAQAEWLRGQVQPGQSLLLSDPPPMTFYYARTPGFRLNTYDVSAAIREVESSSATYFVILPKSLQTQAFKQEVQQIYPQVGPGVYLLERPARRRQGKGLVKLTWDAQGEQSGCPLPLAEVWVFGG